MQAGYKRPPGVNSDGQDRVFRRALTQGPFTVLGTDRDYGAVCLLMVRGLLLGAAGKTEAGQPLVQVAGINWAAVPDSYRRFHVVP